MPFYTGVGSRKCPEDIIALMQRFATYMAKRGYTLRSGAAEGADTAFETGCIEAGGSMRIYMPSSGWQGRPRKDPYVVPDFDKAAVLASEHPAWNYLSDFVQRLHARNVNQVLGDNLQEPSDFLVCWTPDGAINSIETSKKTGGTGQAIRIASNHGVPVYNLFRADHRLLLEDWMNKETTMRTTKLSPSDFAFLWKECKRCYWMKYTQSLPRPYTPMAKIFNTIDGGMQTFFKDKVLSDIDPSLPNIKIIGKNMQCTSEAMPFKDLDIQLYVHGKTDGVAEDVDTGGYVIVDYKTSMPKPEYMTIYAAQLHSYAFAFSKPADGCNSFPNVNRLGLLVYEPKEFVAEGINANLKGELTWVELPMDKKWFKTMLREVAELLVQTEPPEASEGCAFCKYVNALPSFEVATV